MYRVIKKISSLAHGREWREGETLGADTLPASTIKALLDEGAILVIESVPSAPPMDEPELPVVVEPPAPPPARKGRK